MTKTPSTSSKTKPTPVAVYRDRPLRWKDLFLFFLPASAGPILPLLVGFQRAQYALENYGPVAAKSWSEPWYRLSVVALIPLVWLALRRVRQANRFIAVYPWGLTIQGNGWRRWKLTWAQIKAISSNEICYTFLGLPLGNKIQVKLFPVDGKPIRLKGQIKGLKDLSARIKAKIYPGLLQKCRLTLNKGGTLFFGPIKINQKTIAHQGMTLKWMNVKLITLKDGFLYIESTNNQLVKIAVKSIPNIELLLQIIQEGNFYENR